jgi:hypothetical protein
MELMSTKLHQAYLNESILWERELVDYVARCQAQSSGEDSLSSIAASLARLEIRRCLQARTLVRRFCDRPAEEVAAVLSATSLSDHASALLNGNWAAVGLVIE